MLTPHTRPAGSDQQVQFNDAGSFGADGALAWDKANDVLSLTNLTVNGRQNWKLVSKTSAYTAASETVILVDASGGAVTITLPPAASSSGRRYVVKKIDSSANAVTLDGNGSETIDGATTLPLYCQYDFVGVVCDGSNWLVIEDGLRPHSAEMTRDAAQSISTGTQTKVAFDAETWDVGGIADFATNDRFDVKRAGRYLVVCNWGVTGIDDTESGQAFIFVNGSAVRNFVDYSPAANQAIRPQNVGIVSLAAGDTIEMYVEHNEGASFSTLTSEVSKPRMSVHELR
jgi:hypothetical protein